MSVVALRALGLGDLLTAVPALRALSRHHPDEDLVLATTPGMVALARLLPGVDAVVPVGELEPLPRVLEQPRVAVNLHGSGPESHRLLEALRPDRLIAFTHPDVPAAQGPRWTDDEHEVDRWCRLLSWVGIPADPAALEVPVPTGPLVDEVRGAVVVHPGAKSGARRWPPDRFAAVASRLRAVGRPVVVTGSPDERDLARRVATEAGLPANAVVAGRTDVVELLQVVAGAAAVVCGDTGVAHAATATGTPSVVLFGPMSPARWGPPRASDRHVALWHGRHGDPLAEDPFPGLLDIRVDEVLDALDGLLRDDRARPDVSRPA